MALAQGRWAWVSPLPQGNELKKAVFAAGQYVAVGDLGTIVTSADGSNWTAQDSGTREELRDVAWGHGQYVAVGTAIVTSPDARHWTVRRSGFRYPLYGVAYGNGRFVATGDVSLWSRDGRSWTPAKRQPRSYLSGGVVFAKGRFVAVGNYGGIETSVDGRRWTARRGTKKSLYGIAYGDGRFVAVSPEYSGGTCGAILASRDGIRWTVQKAGTRRNEIDAMGIAYGGGRFVTVGLDGDVLTSTHGEGWHAVAVPDEVKSLKPLGDELYCHMANERRRAAFYGVAYGNRQFVAVGWAGAIFTSPDGSVWTPRTVTRLEAPNDVAFIGDRFVGVGSGGTIEASADGESWTAQDSKTKAYLFGIAHGAGHTVVIGADDDGAVIITSTDGGAWQPVALQAICPSCRRLRAVAFGNGRFLVCGDRGTILSSPDAAVWTLEASNVFGDLTEPQWHTAEELQGVAYGDGQFVAVGDLGSILTSSDGKTWTPRSTPRGMRHFAAVTYGDGTFVAAGPVGTLWMSRDGVDWREVGSPGGDILNGLRGMTYGDGQFAGVGFGTLRTSTDGVTWLERSTIPATDLKRIAYGNGRFVAVGYGNVLVSSAETTSDSAATPPPR
jgi:hypothetical protein